MKPRAGDWMRHPRRTRRVTEINRADDVESAAAATQALDRPRADRVVRRAARGLARDVRTHGRAGGRLRALEAAVDDLHVWIHVTGARPGAAPGRVVARGHGGRPVTAAAAAVAVGHLTRAIDAAPDLDAHRSLTRAARVAGTVLLGVDVVALFLVFARVVNLDWAAPAPVPLVGAAVFSAVGAFAMTRLALLLGEHLWVWRRQGRTPEPSARAGVAAALVAGLTVLSLAVGTSVLLRIVDEPLDLGALGVVLGVLVGAAAAIAPWLLVLAAAHDGTEHTRALAALTPIVAWTERRRRRLEAAQDRAREVRRRCRERGRLRLAHAELAIARRHRPGDTVLLVAAAHRGQRLPLPDAGPRLVPGGPDELAPLRAMVELMQRGVCDDG